MSVAHAATAIIGGLESKPKVPIKSEATRVRLCRLGPCTREALDSDDIKSHGRLSPDYNINNNNMDEAETSGGKNYGDDNNNNGITRHHQHDSLFKSEIETSNCGEQHNATKQATSLRRYRHTQVYRHKAASSCASELSSSCADASDAPAADTNELSLANKPAHSEQRSEEEENYDDDRGSDKQPTSRQPYARQQRLQRPYSARQSDDYTVSGGGCGGGGDTLSTANAHEAARCDEEQHKLRHQIHDDKLVQASRKLVNLLRCVRVACATTSARLMGGRRYRVIDASHMHAAGSSSKGARSVASDNITRASTNGNVFFGAGGNGITSASINTRNLRGRGAAWIAHLTGRRQCVVLLRSRAKTSAGL